MGILYLILLVLGVPFGIGFLIGWLVGRNKRNSAEGPDAYQKGFEAGRQAAIVETEQYVQEKEEATALERAQGVNVGIEESEPIVLTDEEQVQQKSERDTKNINTTLYVASFLLVAAAALFIGTALPESVKFAGVWAVVGLFYVGGLVLYSAVERLRPAAVAFVGTGLALIPFTGLALYSYVIADASLAWWITSGIGLAAFMLATMRLQSQVIAYLTMVFVFSLATSSLAVLQTPFLWYFVLIILVAAACNLVASWRPQLVPEVFRRPLDISGQVATPVAVAASLLTYSLTLLEVTAVLSVAALQYAVASLKPAVAAFREPYIFIAKALLSIAVALLVYDISGGDWAWIAYAMIAISLIHQFYALYRRAETFNVYDQAWLWAGFGVQALALLLWLGDMSMIALNLLLLIAVSGLVVYKRREAWYGLVAVAALAVLPIVVGYGVIEPMLETWVVALVFLMMAAGTLFAGQKYKNALSGDGSIILTGAYLLYLVEGVVLAVTEQSVWVAVLLGLAALIIVAISYAHKQPLLQYVANAMAVYAVYSFTIVLSVTYEWRWLMTGIIVGGLFYGLRWLFDWAKESERANALFFSAIVLLGLPALATLWSSDALVNAASMTLLVAGGAILFEGYIKQQPRYYDVAFIVLTIAMQRMFSLAQPDADVLIYTHWWAAVIGILAYYYYSLGQKDEAKWRGIVALGVITFFTGANALASGGMYQLIFLGEHVTMLVIGLLFTNRILSIWGAIGVSLSVLWMLRGFTYVWLTLIALGLIGFAIWRLLKRDAKK